MPELEKVVSSNDFDDWFSLNDTIMGGSSKAVCRASSMSLSRSAKRHPKALKIF